MKKDWNFGSHGNDCVQYMVLKHECYLLGASKGIIYNFFSVTKNVVKGLLTSIGLIP